MVNSDLTKVWDTSLSCVVILILGFPLSSVGKESAYNAGELGSIPGLGRSPGEGNGNPLQYSCLENPMERGAWKATVHGVTRVGHNLANKERERENFNSGALQKKKCLKVTM